MPPKYRDRLLFAAFTFRETGKDLDFLEVVDQILDEITEAASLPQLVAVRADALREKS